MSTCLIFGGAGFVGTHLALHFLETGRFSQIHIADIRRSSLEGKDGITTSITDVRNTIDTQLIPERPEWIFNLAAVHREPGHEAEEYFYTNIRGAENVCKYAEHVGTDNIYFTSSIAVYGPCLQPTNEDKLPMPNSPYGSSKYPAELIHTIWKIKKESRRLIISRPGVIYGPGDPGNIMRMIKAIRKGYFAFPGSKTIHKSYAYIYGFIESIDFTMSQQEKDFIVYNYVESPTETIAEIAAVIKEEFGSKAPVISLPGGLLVGTSKFLHGLGAGSAGIHPVRVRKAGTPTHIEPKYLKDEGFNFEYDFASSLKHWRAVNPTDFE